MTQLVSLPLALDSAKSIKNQVQVNEELTADESRRRYEKERDKGSLLRSFHEGIGRR